MAVEQSKIESKTRLKRVFCDLIRRSTLALSATILVFSPSIVNAFSEKDLGKILSLDACLNCNLSKAHLADLKLQDMELAGANLSGAQLAKTDFEFSNMKGANLSGADLAETRLRSVHFVKANLTNANLKKADLAYASFLLADLTGADFTDADWPDKADFTLAKFCKTTWVDGSIKNKDC